MFGKLQSIASMAGGLAAKVQEKTVNEYLPLIAKLLREKAGPAVLDVLNDPPRITELSRAVYQAMPLPVRMAVAEDAFNSAVLSHKGKLIQLIQSQIEADAPLHAEALVVSTFEQEGGESVGTGPEVVELASAELNDNEHQVISMEVTDDTNNTSPST